MTHHPDLVILDVKMPGSDGLAAARAIRELGLKVAVLILTAFSQRTLIDEARDAGVAAYLVKPFQRIELIPAIDQAMARCEQEWAIDAEAGQAVAEGPRQPATAEDKLETRRLVDGAKGVLMERSGMTESEAFGFIQKTAMGTRSRMIDVARQVLEGTLAPVTRVDAPPWPPMRPPEPTRPGIRAPHPARRDVPGLPGLLRPPGRPEDQAGRGHQCRPRLHLHGGEPGPRPPPDRTWQSPSTYRGHIPRRDRERVQGRPGRDTARPAAPIRHDPDDPRIAGDPGGEAEGFEADDVLATLATEARDRRHPVIIVTGDRDSYQLVEDPFVRVLYNRRGVSDYALYDEAGIEARTGVPPSRSTRSWPPCGATRRTTCPGCRGWGRRPRPSSSTSTATSTPSTTTSTPFAQAPPEPGRPSRAGPDERGGDPSDPRRAPRRARRPPTLGGWDLEEARQAFANWRLRTLWTPFDPLLEEGALGRPAADRIDGAGPDPDAAGPAEEAQPGWLAAPGDGARPRARRPCGPRRGLHRGPGGHWRRGPLGPLGR